jgi:hypothetical protein
MTISWKLEKFGIVAFSICLVELVGIWVPVIYASHHRDLDWRWLASPLGDLYLAGFFAILIAIVGLFRDKRRLLAFLALIFGVLNIALCVAPLAR